MGNFSIHDISPIIVKLVKDCDSDLENSNDDEIISLLRSTAFSYLFSATLFFFSKLLNNSIFQTKVRKWFLADRRQRL
jgi:hypothetical protein